MTAAPEHIADLYPTRGVLDEFREIARHDPVVWGTAADGPFDQARLDDFEAKGYLSFDQLVTPDEVQQFRDELHRLSADPLIRADERTIVERESQEVRSIFEVHRLSEVFASLANDPRLVGRARQLLGSEVYIHQSRVNLKPGLAGKEFYWHSDFETWHAEDGLPRMRTVSFSISLTDNVSYNGPLMIMPGSHKSYIACAGQTPEDHYKSSLVAQQIGVPDQQSLTRLYQRHGIDVMLGKAGSATLFDCNCMHGSNGNITPLPRSNIFIVFNSVANTCVEPFAAAEPRPSFIGARDFTPAG